MADEKKERAAGEVSGARLVALLRTALDVMGTGADDDPDPENLAWAEETERLLAAVDAATAEASHGYAAQPVLIILNDDMAESVADDLEANRENNAGNCQRAPGGFTWEDYAHRTLNRFVHACQAAGLLKEYETE